jgi:hypothetical protein
MKLSIPYRNFLEAKVKGAAATGISIDLDAIDMEMEQCA